MASLFDLCDEKSAESMAVLKEEIENETQANIQKMVNEQEEEHVRTHIFKTYEESLDYLKNNPGKTIRFHDKILLFETEKNLYQSYEQEFDLDGVCCWNVVRYYSFDDLMEIIDKVKKRVKERYNEDDAAFLDKRGFLEYVHI